MADGAEPKQLKLDGEPTELEPVEPITLYGNPVLRKKTPEVTNFDAALADLVEEMFASMYATETGVGLAANQIGRTERVFVFDCRDGLVAHVVNPEITLIGNELQEGEEGCLSLPGIGRPTVRHMHCGVTGFDVKGKPIAYEGEELLARCFQHEVDHLNGLVYLDRLSTKTKRKAEAELKEFAWWGTPSLDPRSDQYP